MKGWRKEERRREERDGEEERRRGKEGEGWMDDWEEGMMDKIRREEERGVQGRWEGDRIEKKKPNSGNINCFEFFYFPLVLM